MDRDPYEVAASANRFAVAGIILSIIGGAGAFLSLQAQVLALELTATNEPDKRFIETIKRRGRIGIYISIAWYIILAIFIFISIISFFVAFMNAPQSTLYNSNNYGL